MVRSITRRRSLNNILTRRRRRSPKRTSKRRTSPKRTSKRRTSPKRTSKRRTSLKRASKRRTSKRRTSLKRRSLKRTSKRRTPKRTSKRRSPKRTSKRRTSPKRTSKRRTSKRRSPKRTSKRRTSKRVKQSGGSIEVSINPDRLDVLDYSNQTFKSDNVLSFSKTINDNRKKIKKAIFENTKFNPETISYLGELSRLTKLQSLDFTNANFDGNSRGSVSSVTTPIANLKHIVHLNLSNLGFLTEQEVSAIASVLYSYKNLQSLVMQDTKLNPNSSIRLIDSLKNKKMKIINFGNSNIGIEGVSKIQENIDTSKLEHLGLSGNNLGDKQEGNYTGMIKLSQLNVLAPNIKGWGGLNTLNISNNKITGEGLQILIPFLIKQKFLRGLDISKNKISNDAFNYFSGTCLIKLVNLNTLIVSDIDITGEGINNLPTALRKMKNLQRFDISDNKLKPKDIAYMSLSFCNTGMNFINYANKQEERPYIPIPTYMSNNNIVREKTQKIQKGELNKGKNIHTISNNDNVKEQHNDFISIINNINLDDKLFKDISNDDKIKIVNYIKKFHKNDNKQGKYKNIKHRFVEKNNDKNDQFKKMFITSMVLNYINDNNNNDNNLKNNLTNYLSNNISQIKPLSLDDLELYTKLINYGKENDYYKSVNKCYHNNYKINNLNEIKNNTKHFSSYYNKNCIQINNTNSNPGTPQNNNPPINNRSFNPNSGNSQYNSNLGNLNTPILDEYKYKFNQ